MKCQNCNKTFHYGFICPYCGVDVFIFEKTRNASIRLYNKGLLQAKNQDLSNAVISLEQSLLFDKKNIQARNLCGLIYIEIGQVADALKHLIISSSLLEEENDAKRYIEMLQKNVRTMEKMNDAVLFYNQALSYIAQGSDDLAIIQLKRAIDFNKNFLVAYNLLALCSLNQNDFEHCNYYTSIVLKKDKTNPLALLYNKEQNSKNMGLLKSLNNKKQPEEILLSSPSASHKRNNNKNGALGKHEVISFLLGGVCTIVVFLILIIPAVTESQSALIKELQSNALPASKTTTLPPVELEKLQAELVTLKKENETYKTEINLQNSLLTLQKANDFIEANDFENASLLLIASNINGFTDDQKAQYNMIKELAFPKAATSFYNKGKSSFLNDNFNEAQGFFENSLKFTSGENFVDDIIYYLGKIAQNNNDKELAKNYYNRILTEFPTSNQKANAENNLSQMQAQ